MESSLQEALLSHLGYLGPCWGHLGRTWGHLGAILGTVGAILEARKWCFRMGGVQKMGSWRYEVKLILTSSLQEAFLAHPGRTYGHLGAILASLGGVLGASWPYVGPSLGHSGA